MASQNDATTDTLGSGAPAAAFIARGAERGADASPRALDASPAFWLAMFMASVFGTNMGDFWADGLGLQRGTGFMVAVAVCVAVVWGDRRYAARTEAFYWVAIVGLRAAATNFGDLLTHDLQLSYSLVALALAALTLAAGWFTRASTGRGASPFVDGWYWVAMLIAGVFGTVGGDLVAHTIGIYAAAALLSAALVALLVVRDRRFPTAVLGYWCIVLAERCAATPAGDALASRHALALGALAAMAWSGPLFLAALLVRRRA